ncbi:hypothetical protein HDU93_007824, partial [Gonapodya sp. JEL0774]
GLSAIVHTAGNPSCHVILRGGNAGPNYEESYVSAAAVQLERAKLPAKVMVDCSHGNSSKQYARQTVVAESVAHQLAESASGDAILGVMVESHINEGRQDIPSGGPGELKYGVSITDACIAWETTVKLLDGLRDGVRARRARKAGLS